MRDVDGPQAAPTDPDQAHDPAGPGVRIDHDGPLTRVVLDDPRRMNPQSPALWARLEQAARELPSTTRVVVLTGAGPHFSAGLDRRFLHPHGLTALFGDAPQEASIAARIAGYQRAFTAWREVDALVVAAVRGHAIGAGFQLALAADLRVLADDASLCMGEILVGLVPDLGGTGRLVELVGPDRALEICLTGRRVGAAEAVGIGLAALAVPGGQLEDTVADLSASVLSADAAAAREMVHLLRGATGRDRAGQLSAEREAQARLLLARMSSPAAPGSAAPGSAAAGEREA